MELVEKTFQEWWVIGSDGERVSAGLDADEDDYDDYENDDHIKEGC